ncbi:MAG: winged helix-turn-helix domain-containing protein [Pyrinomonadaceae bacterium]
MDGHGKHSFQFKSFLLDVTERQLLRDGQLLPLTPKAFDVLAYMVARAGHLVEKDELIQAVWPDSFVEEANIVRIVHTLRKVLGEDQNGNKFIETVAKKGYRFVAKVVTENDDFPERSGNGSSFVTAQGELEAETFLENPKNVAEIEPPDVRWHTYRWAFVLTGFVVVLAIGGWVWSGGHPFRGRAAAGSIPGSTSNTDAFLSYKEGRLLLEKRRVEDQAKALEDFDRAIQLDANFADAYAAKAVVKMWQFDSTRAPDDMAEARTAIDRAFELNGSSSFANFARCRMKVTYDWDFKNGEQSCKKAVELDSNNSDARFELAMFHSMFGRTDQALAEIDTAIALSPTAFNKRNRGWILFYARRYDEAVEQLRQIAETDPEYRFTIRPVVLANVMKRDYAAALDAQIKKSKYDGASPETIELIRSKYASKGWPGVLRVLVDLPKDPKKSQTGVGAVRLAEMYCQLGEFDLAYDSLETAFKQRQIWMIHLARDPLFDPMQNEPRFQELLKRIGLK